MELRIFVEPQEGASYEQQLAMAQAAESHGFGAFFRSDHLLRIKPGGGEPGPTDSWVTLGAIARETSTIRLGTMSPRRRSGCRGRSRWRWRRWMR